MKAKLHNLIFYFFLLSFQMQEGQQMFNNIRTMLAITLD